MDKSPEAIRILIADDHPIFRDGLRRLLESEPDFEVVGEAVDGEEALELTESLHPDILLLDLAMHVPGLEALRALATRSTPVRTILLTAAVETEQVVEALELGARGVVLKESATELLFKSIRTVMDGQYWIRRERVSDLVESLKSLMAPSAGQERKKNFGLSPRELEIVSTIVAGYSNKDIAKKFTLSEQTVKHHLTNIFNKVGVSSRLELAIFAINHKLVGDPQIQ